MSGHFFNTTNEHGQTLIHFEGLAGKQTDLVLHLFRTVKKPMAWFEVNKYLNINESSVKRSLTVLKDKGLLCKTDIKVLSIYNKPSYKYKLI